MSDATILLHGWKAHKTSDGDWVCDVPVSGNSFPLEIARGPEGVIRLIAAAPDLLAERDALKAELAECRSALGETVRACYAALHAIRCPPGIQADFALVNAATECESALAKAREVVK